MHSLLNTAFISREKHFQCRIEGKSGW